MKGKKKKKNTLTKEKENQKEGGEEGVKARYSVEIDI